MELMTESWTDRRLDEFRSDVDHRFELVDQRFDAVDQRFDAVDQRFDAVDRKFEEVDRRFGRVEVQIQDLRSETRTEFIALRGEMREGFEAVAESFNQTHRLMVQSAIGIAAGFATIIAGLLGLIATQL